ncbi:MAG: T9SS type A sorting domain-containing protein [Balneolales bacterium]|nr:T9SS type A sorting domain-containing protein [Balneolales bacterium]
MLRFCALLLLCTITTSLQAQTISAGSDNSVILRFDTLMVSWGNNTSGKLGIESSGSYLEPISTPYSFVSISTGNSSTIALKEDGSLWGWGDYQNTGTFLTSHEPTQIGTRLYKKISTVRNHSLAIDLDGHVWAWGNNTFGQVGDGSTELRPDPVQIGDQIFIEISAGHEHSLAIDENGHLWSWGNQPIGSGSYEASHVPVQVSTETFIQVSAGSIHSLAIHSDSTLWAWGTGFYGTTRYTGTPAQVSTEKWKSIQSSTQFSVALKSDGTLWTWGANRNGQLGNGNTFNRNIPTQISELQFTEISSKWSHSLAKAEDGSIYAWGENYTGAVGNGTTENQLTPANIINALVQIQPSSPQQAVASMYCDKTARLWWSAPENSGKVSAYIIESQIEGSSTWTRIKSTSADVNEATIDNLEIGVGVSFRVAAENIDGISDFSDPTEFITPQSDDYSCEITSAARWLTAGSLHTFYMSSGMEREHALVSTQQYGMRWPAIHPKQDAIASKGLWIGTKNFTDEAGQNEEYKVITMGPRSNGATNFFPFEHRLISRFQPTVVSVNGDESYDIDGGLGRHRVDKVDPSLPSDQMIYTRVHTSIGLMMERHNYQWSNYDNDNYHVQEYVFTNNGATGASPLRTLPENTLEDVYITLLHRHAPVRQTRYVIGNASGWGYNTMNDRFGDGMGPDYGLEGTSLRGSFSWHGHFPGSIVDHDNIGGPIWTGARSPDVSDSDTTGRLGAYHFIGYATLHADTSPSDNSDNLQQPFTMSEINSDAGFMPYGNEPNPSQMVQMYNEMIKGRTDRHAYLVEPSGTPGFISPTNDPSRGTSGGFSNFTTYGPYTIPAGESVRIVVAEAVSGISREQALVTGQQFKRGEISALEKNEVVFQGRDSLMQTFVRAKSNFDDGFNLPRTPAPPTRFDINRVDGGINLTWEYDNAGTENITGFSIWRASEYVDAPYTKVAELNADSRMFFDTPENPLGNIEPGVQYYYYITADAELSSGRYFTQSYIPVNSGPVSIENPSELPRQLSLSQNYPNPFNPQTTIRYEIPDFSMVRLDVFDVLGRRVARLVDFEQAPGEYSVNFDASRLSSGVYIYQISNGKDIITKKMLLIK